VWSFYCVGKWGRIKGEVSFDMERREEKRREQ